MNAHKRARILLASVAVAALAVLAFGFTPALRADTAPTDQDDAGYTAVQAQLWQMRNIMHYGRFVATPVADGVQVAVTSDDAALVEAIQAQFGTGNELPSPVPGSTTTAAAQEGGVTLTFRTDDAALVTTLQAQGAGLAYGLLRNNMHAVMTALQANGNAYGPGMGRGMMGGWMHGPRGERGGWMHGPGQGQGYGPRGGMMGPGYGPGQGYGPQGQQAQ